MPGATSERLRMKFLVQSLLDRLGVGASKSDIGELEARFLASASMYQTISRQGQFNSPSGLANLRFEVDGTLAPGVYHLTQDEFVSYYGSNAHRTKLLEGLGQLVNLLKLADCKRIYVGGSFVTTCVNPSDFDGCYLAEDMDLEKLSELEAALAFDSPSDSDLLHQKYGGTIEPIRVIPGLEATMLEVFQFDTRNKKLRGIVAIDL